MVASYSFQRGFPVRFYIQPGNPKGEPVLDQRQVLKCREAMYWNVDRPRVAAEGRLALQGLISHLGLKSSLQEA